MQVAGATGWYAGVVVGTELIGNAINLVVELVLTMLVAGRLVTLAALAPGAEAIDD